MAARSVVLRASMLLAGLFAASPALAQDPEPSPEPAPEPAPPPPEPAPPEPETPPPPPPDYAAPANPPAEGSAAAPSAGAAPAPQADTGATPAPAPAAAPPKPKKLAWRGTTLSWDNSATTETVGIGDDVNSKNPTYDMTFELGPRYYLWEGEGRNLTLRGGIGLTREMTDSDITTERGEWSLTDASLGLAYSDTLYEGAEGSDVSTALAVRLPTLTFPTSKMSANNGKILGVGASVGLNQGLPLLGSEAAALQTLGLGLSLGYTHTFTEAIVPTHEDLGRVRLRPDGVAVAGDQLTGGAYAKHSTSVTASVDVGVASRVGWSTAFGWRPTWKYELPEPCVATSTGCVDPDNVGDPQRFVVSTVFSSELGFEVLDEMSLAVGYANATGQLGFDGQRRSFFYSPDARVYVTLTGKLDKIYEAAAGDSQPQAASARTRSVARR